MLFQSGRRFGRDLNASNFAACSFDIGALSEKMRNIRFIKTSINLDHTRFLIKPYVYLPLVLLSILNQIVPEENAYIITQLGPGF